MFSSYFSASSHSVNPAASSPCLSALYRVLCVFRGPGECNELRRLRSITFCDVPFFCFFALGSEALTVGACWSFSVSFTFSSMFNIFAHFCSQILRIYFAGNSILGEVGCSRNKKFSCPSRRK